MDSKATAVASLRDYISDLDLKLESVEKWQAARKGALEALAILERAPSGLEMAKTSRPNGQLRPAGKQSDPNSGASRFVASAKTTFDLLRQHEASFATIYDSLPDTAKSIFTGDNAVSTARKALQRKCGEIGLEYDDLRQVFRKKEVGEKLASAS